MPGRIGDVVTDPILERCDGCAQTTLLCQVCLDHNRERCCRTCTHIHPSALLKQYGMLDR